MAESHGFSIEETLHDGVKSTILRAKRVADGRRVVLKLPKADYLDRRRMLEIRHEHAVLERVDGEAVVRSLGVSELSERLALVLEDFGGVSMAEHIEAHGRMSTTEFLHYAKQIVAGLAGIHARGVIHKDVKPHNLIVNTGLRLVKIADFSIASVLSSEVAMPLRPSDLAGTLAYMAPEQTGRMNRGVDFRADFYALGATFYEMLVGRRPFEQEEPLELLHAHVAMMPRAPHEVEPAVPRALSDIVMKLLQKSPEERYQTEAGLLRDLVECERQLSEIGVMRPFELAKGEAHLRFRLPEQMRGREREASLLLSAFERARLGRCEVVLLSGAPGIGKSSLVNELHRPLVSSRGRFASGKSVEVSRDKPFGPVLMALRELLRGVLSQPQAEVDAFALSARQALSPNEGVLIELLPEAEALLGKAPSPSPLPATESRNRVVLALSRFLLSFATEASPLVLFIDDLQWADGATLSLLASLAADPSSQHLLLLGAYRDGDVGPSHPVSLMAAELSRLGRAPQQVTVGPLGEAQVAAMVDEALSGARCEPLSRLVLAKTGGNPYFVRELLRVLYQERAIRLDEETLTVHFDAQSAAARALPDNVVSLVVGEIGALPGESRELLEQAALLGSEVWLSSLVTISRRPVSHVTTALWPLLERGLLLPLGAEYRLLSSGGLSEKALEGVDMGFRFAHDRIREASLSAIEGGRRRELDLAIGRVLIETLPGEAPIERLFEALGHFAPHVGEGTDAGLRAELLPRFLSAGRAAKASGAYEVGARLLSAGVRCLPERAFDEAYEQAFALHVELCECQYLAGQSELAEAGFEQVRARAKTETERALVRAGEVTLATNAGRLAQAIELGIAGLVGLGEEIGASPSQEQIGAALGAVLGKLGSKAADELLELPPLASAEVGAKMLLLASMAPAGYLMNQALFTLLVLRIVELSLDHGNGPLSPFGYVVFGVVLAAGLDDPARGEAFARLAVELAHRGGSQMLYHRVRYLRTALISHWTTDGAQGIAELSESFKGCLETGDRIYAGHCVIVRLARKVAAGVPIGELLVEDPVLFEILRGNKDPDAIKMFAALHNGVADLAGPEAPRLDGGGEGHEPSGTAKAYIAFVDLERATFLGKPGEALAAARAGAPLLPYIGGLMMLASFQAYHALAIAQAITAANEEERGALLEALSGISAYLEKCATRSPSTYAHLHLIVAAEEARVKAPGGAGVELYEQAIEAARAGGFVQFEALANELSGQHHLERGRRTIGAAYLREAAFAYERWGASAKAERLRAERPELLLGRASSRGPAISQRSVSTITSLSTESSVRSTVSSDSIAEVLDLTSVLKASQAISGELHLPKLVARLLRIAIEGAGAQRGVLLLQREGALCIEAEADAQTGEVQLFERQPLEGNAVCSQAIVLYAARSGETVLLDDAGAKGPFVGDAHVKRGHVRSVLCVPLRQQGRLIGVIYFENNVTAEAFTPLRQEMVKALSGQAAIALENARLYDELEKYNEQLEKKVEERTLELAESLRQVVDGQRRLAGELADAASYVRSLLPAPASSPVAIDWRYLPSAHLGGDALGYLWLSDHELAFYVLDVCGHGVASALFAVAIHNALQSRRGLDADLRQPSSLLCALNQAFQSQAHSGMYFTIWYGVLDTATRTLRHASAAHPGAVVVPQQGAASELLSVGPMLGILPEVSFVDAEVTLPEGARVFVFSDGAYEVLSPRGELLDYAAFARELARRDATCGETLDRMVRLAFTTKGGGSLDDDFSMLSIEL